jgi:hypothetical protein
MDVNSIYGTTSDLAGMNVGSASLGQHEHPAANQAGGLHHLHEAHPGMNPNLSSSAMANPMMLLQNFWQSQLAAIEHGELDFKTFQLPLARIKKVMKTDDDVKVCWVCLSPFSF